MVSMTTTTAKRAILYLRLSDLRADDLNANGNGKSFDDRERTLRELAARLGWTVVRVVIENDVAARNGKQRNASAFKRRKVTLPDGSTAMRVYRPGFRSILDDLAGGRADALLAEDLDRCMRDPRDLEDLIDVVEAHKVNARSLAGSLTFTDGGTDAEITMARLMVTIANKSSRDTARRVTAARERQATHGQFGGGRRPFGFNPDGVTVRPDEAKIIEDCAHRVLQGDVKGNSLKALTAELRARDVPTVTGAPWRAVTLRQILLRPRNAGRMVHQGAVIGDAPWDPIVEPDVYDAVVRLLTDPARNPGGPGPAPKWLGSGVYLCGVCNDGTTVQVSGGSRGPRYWCKDNAHLARSAPHVDAYVIGTVLTILKRPDAVDLFTLARPEVDVTGLRAQAKAIRSNLDGMAADRTLGLIDRAQMIEATRTGHARLEVIDRALADAVVGESPAAELASMDDVDAGWNKRPLAIQQAIVRETMTVTIMPSGRRGRGFDTNTVRIDPLKVDHAA